MQSGIKRKTFNVGPCPVELRASLSTKKNGQRTITGLASDSLNRLVIASTLDGTISVRLEFLEKPRLIADIIALEISSSTFIQQSWSIR